MVRIGIPQELSKRLVFRPRGLERSRVPQQIRPGPNGLCGRLLFALKENEVVRACLIRLNLLLRELCALAQEASSSSDLVAHLFVLFFLCTCPFRDGLARLEALLGITQHGHVTSLGGVLHVMTRLKHFHLTIMQRNVTVAVLRVHLLQEPLLLTRSMVLLAQLLCQLFHLPVQRLDVLLQVRGLLGRLTCEHALSIHL